jgi:hypothetical protein
VATGSSPLATRTCRGDRCDEVFEPARPNQLYHSEACRTRSRKRAYRATAKQPIAEADDRTLFQYIAQLAYVRDRVSWGDAFRAAVTVPIDDLEDMRRELAKLPAAEVRRLRLEAAGRDLQEAA